MVGAPGVTHQRQAIGLQSAFQQKHCLVWRDGIARRQGYCALQWGVHDVINTQYVAQHGPNDLGDRGFFETEGDRSPADRSQRLGHRNDLTIALNDARLWVFGGVSGFLGLGPGLFRGCGRGCG